MPFLGGKSWGIIHIADQALLAVERRQTRTREGIVEAIIACEPRQNRLLIIGLALRAWLMANLIAAQPLTAPTLIH
jgi:spermidine synthase